MEKQKRCRNCGSYLEVRKTKQTPAQLRKAFYYTAYYYCNTCNRLYHDEQFKIVNQPLPTFTVTEPELSEKKYDVEIWTDGACVHNGTPRAKAAWAFVSDETERAGQVEGRQTNNIAEGLAIYYALMWAAEKGHKVIRLHTDSQISIYNLQKEPHKIKMNAEIFYNIAGVIKKNKLQVDFQKVLGHSGDPNNERADKLANTLATQA